MRKHPKPQMGTESKVLERRFTAMIIDSIIIMIIIGGLTFWSLTTFPSLTEGEYPPFSFLILVGIGPMFFYYFFFEGFTGQTIGKKLMGIVVVREDGSPCTYKASFIRNFLRIIDALGLGPLIYLMGGIVILLTKKRQRIGDLVAKTIVVKII